EDRQGADSSPSEPHRVTLRATTLIQLGSSSPSQTASLTTQFITLSSPSHVSAKYALTPNGRRPSNNSPKTASGNNQQTSDPYSTPPLPPRVSVSADFGSS